MIDPALLSVALFWGAGNVVLKWLLDVFDPAGLFALRMAAAALLMGALLLIRRRAIASRDALMLMLIGGGIVAAQLLSFVYAMSMTTASEGSLLISTAPVWTAIMVALLGMEIVTGLNWLGIVIAFGGVAMVVLGRAGPAPDAPARLAGDMLMIGSACLYGLYMVVSKRWMVRLGALQVVCYTFIASGIVLVIVGYRQALATPWQQVTWGHWLGFFHVVVIAGVLGILIWYRSIRLTTASSTAVYQYLVPGISVVAAAIFLHERLALLQMIGIAVTLVGVYLARVPPGGGLRLFPLPSLRQAQGKQGGG